MESQKALEFKGTAGGYFVVFLVTLVLTYIPIFGWAFVLNFTSGWIIDNTLIQGKKAKFNAGYGEALVFVLVSAVLLLITLGIYSFWWVPKVYRYVADHTSLEDEAPAVAIAAPAAPVAPDVQSAPTTETPVEVTPVATADAPVPESTEVAPEESEQQGPTVG